MCVNTGWDTLLTTAAAHVPVGRRSGMPCTGAAGAHDAAPTTGGGVGRRGGGRGGCRHWATTVTAGCDLLGLQQLGYLHHHGGDVVNVPSRRGKGGGGGGEGNRQPRGAHGRWDSDAHSNPPQCRCGKWDAHSNPHQCPCGKWCRGHWCTQGSVWGVVRHPPEDSGGTAGQGRELCVGRKGGRAVLAGR